MLTRILIADDSHAMREALTALLDGHANWKVCAQARNGLEAVYQAAELKPDLVILDYSMPMKDGLGAARNILSTFPAVPILLYTNYMFPTLVAEASRAGVRKVVDKSASVNEFVTAVENVLGEKPRRTVASD